MRDALLVIGGALGALLMVVGLVVNFGRQGHDRDGFPRMEPTAEPAVTESPDGATLFRSTEVTRA